MKKSMVLFFTLLSSVSAAKEITPLEGGDSGSGTGCGSNSGSQVTATSSCSIGATSQASPQTVTARSEDKTNPSNNTNKLEDPALITAIKNNCVEDVRSLIRTGANLDILYQNRWTPLMLAADRGYLEIVQELVNARPATLNLQDPNEGWTALMFATHKKHVKIVHVFTKLGAAPNIQAQGGTTALMIAAYNGHEDIARMLIANGARLDLQTKKDKLTPLMIAVKNKHTDVALLLIGRLKSASLDIQDAQGWTALMFAICNNLSDVVVRLVCAGANLNIKNSDDVSALMLAAQAGFIDIISLLVYDPGTALNIYDRNGTTALMAAAARGHRKAVEHIVSNTKTNPCLINSNGQDARAIAEAAGYSDIVSIIEKAMEYYTHVTTKNYTDAPSTTTTTYTEEPITTTTKSDPEEDTQNSAGEKEASALMQLLTAGANPCLVNNNKQDACAIIAEAARRPEIASIIAKAMEYFIKIHANVTTTTSHSEQDTQDDMQIVEDEKTV